MKTQKVVFSTFSIEEGKEYDRLTVWKDVFVKLGNEWQTATVVRVSTGENTIEIYLKADEIERLKESLNEIEDEDDYNDWVGNKMPLSSLINVEPEEGVE